ncbi:MAG: Lysophospholipase 1 [Chrysothrix sp. TS-e1954]|nr:MAG: Lysophospholipase 1 [Chrysothrix sp. TS-e1954]
MIHLATPEIQHHVARAAPVAPSGYQPASVSCPSARPTIRRASSLSQEETSWLQTRRKNTVQPMQDLLQRSKINGFDVAGFFNQHSDNVTNLPNIGIAASGGGYRALMNGAGAIAAFDSRTPNSTSIGHLGGLLQSSTYLAGLSGGAWLVGSLFANNFTSVQAIIDAHGSLWDFTNSIFEGPNKGFQILTSTEYYSTVNDEVQSKGHSQFGFNLSITDYWGRALSFQLINATDGGPSYTYSSIANQSFLTEGSSPLPLLIADERAPGQSLIAANTTVYEFNPWEMGSWDPQLYGFAPTQYLGSNFSAGSLPQEQPCINGYDNLGYVYGSSSTLFNEFLLEFNTTVDLPSFFEDAINDVLTDIGTDENDIADWTPNPFYHFNNKTNRNADSKRLTLVDGGEDLQNIPFNPLIQPIRNVDIVFAIDSSADTNDNWPNGTSIVATYERSLNQTIENGTAFPSIPSVQTFVNLGLNNKPTFFGCDVSNSTHPNNPGPLIVYLPNTPYAFNSNFTTFTPSYSTAERNAAIENGYDAITQGNSSLDVDWPACVGCAILSRALHRTNSDVPQQCTDCFSRYCWNGTLDDTNTTYAPTPKLKVISGASTASPKAVLGGLIAVVSLIWLSA